MAMVDAPSRFDVYLVNLDPTVGHEIKKTRPAVVISPNEMNHNLRTLIIAPMTSKGRDYPTRIPIIFADRAGEIVLDQIRTIDQKRLVKLLGKLAQSYQKRISRILVEMFEL